MKNLLAIFALTCLVGCGTVIGPSSEDFRPSIISAISMSTLSVETPVDTVVTSECDGSGWITHGDGHKTKCPGCAKCKPDGKKSAKPCGSACTCDGECPCTEKKECLTKPIVAGKICGEDCVCEAGKCVCVGRECVQGESVKLPNGQAKAEPGYTNPEVRLTADNNLQVCSDSGCAFYYSYNNAYKLGLPLLVAHDVDPKEYPALAERAKREGKVFAVQMMPVAGINKGVTSFAAPKGVKKVSASPVFSGGCASCSRGR